MPQSNYRNMRFLRKVEYSSQPLMLPDVIEEDVIGITKAISKKSGLSKFLFFGAPGSGKTESVYQIARLLNRDILTVSFEQLVEISRLPYGRVIVLFDEIDALVLDRVNRNDLREMGRVTSVFLKELEHLNDSIPIIATTNLIENFDKAILRRFDATVSFDRYEKEDLIEIADAMLSSNLKNATNSINKIMNEDGSLTDFKIEE